MDESSISIAPAAQEFWLPGGPVGVMIVHGYGGTIGDYRHLAERLHQAGFSVRGVRLAGHGAGHQHLAQFTIFDLQESVRAAAEAVMKHCQSLVIIGASFGGDLAIDYIAAHSEHRTGLITINTPLVYKHAMGKRIWLNLLRLRSPYFRKPSPGHAVETAAASMGSTTHWPIAGLLAADQFISQHIVPVLPRLRVPALIMKVNADHIFDSKSADRLFDQLGSTQKTLLPIPAKTHNPFRDPAAEEFMITHIERFLENDIAKKIE